MIESNHHCQAEVCFLETGNHAAIQVVVFCFLHEHDIGLSPTYGDYLTKKPKRFRHLISSNVAVFLPYLVNIILFQETAMLQTYKT